MAIFLNQSDVLFGVNISFADFFCVIILMVLAFSHCLIIPIIPIVFFLVVSMSVLLTAVFYVPFHFELYLDPIKIISDYIKLCATILYFFIGYNLANLNLITKTIKWYSIFGILIGLLGVTLTVLNLKIFSQVLFYADTRYKGLMIDPNYFSVILITSSVYLTRLKEMKVKWKLVIFIITFLSVLAAGSKTGLITLFCYLLIRTFEYVFSKKKNIKMLVIQLVLIVMTIIITTMAFNFFQQFISDLATSRPSFARVYLLFADFNGAVSGNGSERDRTWYVALQIIKLSPLFGIGIGTYTSIASSMFNYNNVAHNTFLQITAEWGLPLAVFFLSYLFYTLGKATFSKSINTETNLILRDIIIIVLFGSMAITLSNARILWFFLGAIVYSLDRNKINSTNK
ncbi:O-antigen ligase family protein [Anaerobacillus isosaccharinicus]|nr:O-antigen ligase family protein [Anaerobacillus isosaccharinicus]MBA5586886.1 O-antigen ligase family protein [Anaerobacillus isosaccharinicus]QOY34905.1 O-antigen ligase family protein [Anaerobacillus isosaccharinicus]